jgi:hypothetical protein
MAEAARAQRIQGFLARLLQGDAEEDGPAQEVKVITLLERGATAASALNTNREVQSDLYATLGPIFHSAGDLDRGEHFLTLALERQRALFGAEHAKVGETLTLLGAVRESQGQLPGP